MVRRNDSFVLQRIQQTEVTLFDPPGSGNPTSTHTNVLFASLRLSCVVHGVSWTCKLLFIIGLATLLRRCSGLRCQCQRRKENERFSATKLGTVFGTVDRRKHSKDAGVLRLSH